MRTLDNARIRLLEAGARRRRKAIQSEISALPVVECAPQSSLHLRMLCGHAQVDMGILATWSILRFLPPCCVTILSDGSLTTESEERWRRVLDGVRFVSKTEADELVAHRTETTYPNVWRLRNTAFMNRKLVDVHCVGPSSALVLMDSDVLCFQQPDEVLRLAEQSTVPYAWARDMIYAYPKPMETLHEIFELEFPSHVNAGFMLLPNWSDEAFTFLENLIERILRDGRIPLDHFWMEQALYAACSTLRPTSRPLSSGYATGRGRTTSSDVVRHYVGVRLVRPRFWLEGAPRLLDGLKLEAVRG